MQFYDKVQSAILLDRGGLSLDDIHKSFVMNDLVFNDVHNKPVEVRPGFVALLGADDLMVTVEFLDRPADFAVFRQSLSSYFNRTVLCPDAEDRIRRHRSHILINVSQGALPQVLKSFTTTVGVASEGATLAQFQKRLG